MGQALGLAAVSEARASACVSIYSRMFVSLPFRTVMAKTQWSSNVLFVALILPVAKPTTTTRSPCAMNSGGSGYEVSTVSLAFCSTSASPACPRCVPASGQFSPGMIHSISSADNASKPCSSRRPSAARKFFTIWTFSCVLIEISPFPLTRSVCDLIGRFATVLLGPNRAVADRLLLLLEQILEDERTPSFPACVHQCATLVELSQLDGCEPELRGQICHRRNRILLVTRQKDNAMAALDDRIGSQDGRTQVIKAFHELCTAERSCDESGGREAVQLFGWNAKRVRRVDDRLTFPIRQGLRNLATFPERYSQDDCVGLECIPQRLGDDRGSNRPSLRRQRLGRPAARDGHVDVFTGEGVGEGLADLTESYNRVAHNASPISC